ncbi:MFS transporter [Nocardiopsis sp. Huas11]|uniref:MFS transporter n=1 Tax=Nocardiopsis sp. Huas11 TaxID=2183912 RepID=UPI000EB27FAD|nr:MFS transporter [Nocardiopsis sp. Huas11]RKS05748.1 MFS transporter [Nocardiopsis sp. Huas11]
MSGHSTPEPAHPDHPEVVRDWRGRSYRVGPTARVLTGLPRPIVLTRALTAVAAIGVLQFGYGAAVPTLVVTHGWSPAQALVPFLLWALFQGATAPLPHHLAVRRLLTPGQSIGTGAALCAAALVALGHVSAPLPAALAYGVLGGVGAGLVYHSCADLVGGWFPDRPGIRFGAVGGAFALGAVPLLPALALAPSPAPLPTATTVLAAAVLLLGLAGGIGQRQAPRRWWPPGADPRAVALRGNADPPAAADFSTAQAWASGRSLPALHAVVALSGAGGLFTIAVLPLVLVAADRPAAETAAVVTAFAAASGLGRIASGAAVERTGRRRLLAASLGAAALALAGLAVVADAGPTALLVVLAAVAGAGTGSCYPLSRAVTEAHFGSDRAAGIPRLVHSSKAVGGLLGVGAAVALLALAPSPAAASWLLTAAVALALAALLTGALRRPFPVRTLPIRPKIWTAGRRRAPM